MTRQILIAAQDVTAGVQRPSFRLSQRGGAGLQTLVASLQMWKLPGVTVEEEATIEYKEDAASIFKGIVRRPVRRTDASDRLWIDVTAQDLSSLAGDDVAYDPLAADPATSGLRTTQETDKARIQWLFSTFGTKGITVGGNCATLLASFPLDENGQAAMDFTGMTLAEGMDAICQMTGGAWYVDQQYDLHYFDAENLTAPWSLSDAPNGTTSFGFSRIMLPSDTIDLRNAVLVIGTGYSELVEHPTSQALYGVRRVGVVRDPAVTTSAQAQQAATAFFAVHAYAKIDGSLRTYKVGLRPGMLVHITSASLGIDSQFLVQETELTLEPARPVVDIRYGDRPIDLSTMIGGVASQARVAFDRAVSAEQAAGVDVTPPAVPTGLTLLTGTRTAADGSDAPYLSASWTAVGDADLEAYELEVDRALSSVPEFAASAGGSGGSLPAGVYAVRVTAVGEVDGETPGDVQTVEIASGDRLYVNITAMTGAGSYNVYASRAGEPLYALNTTTTGSNVEVTTEGSGSTAPTESDATSFIDPLPFRTSATSLMTEAVQGGVWYAVRVLAIDTSGNRSNWTSVQGVTVAPDTTAPEIPTGLTAAGGFRLIGLRWNRNTESDLEHYGVRYAPEDGGNPGNPDTAQWSYLQTRATSIVLMGLEPDTLYFAEVRAIDRSGHCVTSDVDSTAVDADANLDAGWSDWATATPSLVGAADVSFNSVITSILAANEISADDIKAGTLEIGGKPNVPDFLIVYDGSGVEIGRWDQYGLIVTDPTNTDRQVRVKDGNVSFSTDGGSTWQTAIGPEGVIADSIRLGIAPGGHNAIPNSSFELSAFATWLSSVWTSSADWQTGTSQVNVNTATGDLYIATAAF